MADLTDEEIERLTLTTRASFARQAIRLHAEHLPRALELIEEIARRRPELAADLATHRAFAAKVRDEGVPDVVGEPLGSAVVERLQALAIESERCACAFGTVAWRYERDAKPAPSDPLYRGLKGLMRRHRKHREDQRARRRVELEQRLAQATGEERAGLERERARVDRLDVVTLCLDPNAL